MALNQTTTTIVGRLASNPDHKLTTNDVDVTHFRLASNERRFDKQANQWVNGDTLFIDVTCWRRLAFNVHACLVKGDPVVVHGRLYTAEYEVEGKRRFQTRMEALSIGPDLGWISTALRRRPKAEGDATAQDQAPGQACDDATDQSADRAVETASTRAAVPPSGRPAGRERAAVPEGHPTGERSESTDELVRQLLDQRPELADGDDGQPAERKEVLMAGV